jgi:hypothetical protein
MVRQPSEDVDVIVPIFLPPLVVNDPLLIVESMGSSVGGGGVMVPVEDPETFPVPL